MSDVDFAQLKSRVGVLERDLDKLIADMKAHMMQENEQFSKLTKAVRELEVSSAIEAARVDDRARDYQAERIRTESKVRRYALLIAALATITPFIVLYLENHYL